MINIGITTHHFSDNEGLRSFCAVVGASCPCTRTIWLSLYSHTPSSTQPISFRTLEPLLQCAQLEVLRVGHNYPMTLNDPDIIAMGEAWPSIVELGLCSDPLLANVSLNAPGTPLSAVVTFTKACPALRTLGLYISRQRLSGTKAQPCHQLDKSRGLRELVVGASSVNDGNERVADFIGRMGGDVSILARTSDWRKAVFWASKEEELVLERRRQDWGDVEKILKLMRRIREEAHRRDW